MTKNEMLQAARDAGLLFNEDAGTELAHELHIANLTDFWNAAMERAARYCETEVSRKSSDINGHAFYIAAGQCASSIRSLKIKEGE